MASHNTDPNALLPEANDPRDSPQSPETDEPDTVATPEGDNGFSPDLVSVSSKYAHRLMNSSCFITLVNFPVNALYISFVTSKSVGNRISKYP